MPNSSFLRNSVTVTPTLDTSAYANSDILFNPVVVSPACTANNVPTYIVGIDVFDLDDQTLYDFRLIIMKASTSLGTINSAPNISDTNGLDILADILVSGSATTSDGHDMGGFKLYTVNRALLPIPVEPATDTPNIYVAAVVVTGTPTHTASGMRVRFWFQDTYPF